MKGLIITYLLAYGGAIISLFNPFIGLLIYICFAIVQPEAMWFWSVPPGHYSRIVAVALLIGWGLQGFGVWRFGLSRPVVAAFLGLWIWSAVGAIVAPNQSAAWRFVESLSKIVLPFLVGITTVDSVEKLKQLVWVIVLSQSYVAYEFNLSYLAGYNRVFVEGFAGMDNNSVAIALVTGMGLAFFLGLPAKAWWTKGLAFGSAALMGHAVLFSFSRGGMLAAMVTGAAAFLLIPRQPRHYLLLALAGLIALRLAGPEVQVRFATAFADPVQRDVSAQSRIQLWGACWDSMLKHPVLGLGPDHWPLTAPEYGWPVGKEAHSLWLQTGAELGFPGLACLIAFYGLGVARLWPLARGSLPVSHPWLADGARMVIASLVGFAVAAQFVSLERLEVPYYIALIGAGVLKLASVPASVPVAAPSSLPAVHRAVSAARYRNHSGLASHE